MAKDTGPKMETEKAAGRAVYDKSVPAQRGEIFKVTSMGVVIEYTDKFPHAQSAYQGAGCPKSLYRVTRSGRSEKIYEALM